MKLHSFHIIGAALLMATIPASAQVDIDRGGFDQGGFFKDLVDKLKGGIKEATELPEELQALEDSYKESRDALREEMKAAIDALPEGHSREDLKAAIAGVREENAEVIAAQNELQDQIKAAIIDARGGHAWGEGLSEAAKNLRNDIKAKHEALKELRKGGDFDREAFKAEHDALKELRKALIDEVRKAREDGDSRGDDDAE